MKTFTSVTNRRRPSTPLSRLRRSMVGAFHDANAAQRLLFEVMTDYDRDRLEPLNPYGRGDPDGLRWIDGPDGWHLVGRYLP